MNTKIAIIFLATFVLAMISSSVADVEPKKDDKDEPTIVDKVDSFFKQNLKIDDMWKGLTSNLKEFGEKVEKGAKEFAQTIQEGTNRFLNQDKHDKDKP